MTRVRVKTSHYSKKYNYSSLYTVSLFSDPETGAADYSSGPRKLI